MISLKNVSKIYDLLGKTFVALDNVTLDIESGEFVAVLGESGSGKSTMLNLIAGLDLPSEGSITVNGLNVITADDKTLSAFRNKTIGFIFQSFHLEPMRTAVDNVMVPLLFANHSRAKARQMALESLRLVGLADKSYNRTSQLSAGQCQRVAVARAIVNKAGILLADEPTGNLDANTGRGIIRILKEFNRSQGATVLLVTHDEEVAGQVPRHVEIKNGRLVKDTGRREV